MQAIKVNQTMQPTAQQDPFADEPEFELEETIAVEPEQGDGILPSEETVLVQDAHPDSDYQALLLVEQRQLNAQLLELAQRLNPTTNAAPEQSSAKQFSTAIHYARHEQNYYLAAKWFRKAAMQGHSKAQFYLAMLFVKGQGVPKSLFHAYSWLSLASCQQLSEAIEARKQIEPHLTAKQMQAALKVAADRFEQIQDLSQ